MFRFNDQDIKNLDLSDTINFSNLFVYYLCGQKKFNNECLNSTQKTTLEEVIKDIKKKKLAFEQFNEILLFLNQNRIETGFFKFFFNNEKSIDLEQLKIGITKFRGLSLVHFGNIKFTYKIISKKNYKELRGIFREYIEDKQDIELKLKIRPDPIIGITEIEREKTWYNGYLSAELLIKETEKLEIFKKSPKCKDPKKFEPFDEYLIKLDEEIKETRNMGLRNVNTFLIWDYIDVYIATSMRHKCEFEETFDFLKRLSSNPEINALKLRIFDPTQSITKLSRNKGLVEGLMLKRAKCTIYMIQESDTFGKDSELAATLAQKKPVIAFIPDYKEEELTEKIKEYPLGYIKKLILEFLADGVFEEEPFPKTMGWQIYDQESAFENLRDKLLEFIKNLDKYRLYEQPFELFEQENEKFKLEYLDFLKICEVLAIATKIYWKHRAETLSLNHPLGMQIDLDSGVANGVLVVRNYETCIEVLKAILTNSLEFEIRHHGESDTGYTGLYEKNSGSLYRIITDDETLTNSFWNFFKKKVDTF